MTALLDMAAQASIAFAVGVFGLLYVVPLLRGEGVDRG